MHRHKSKWDTMAACRRNTYIYVYMYGCVHIHIYIYIFVCVDAVNISKQMKSNGIYCSCHPMSRLDGCALSNLGGTLLALWLLRQLPASVSAATSILEALSGLRLDFNTRFLYGILSENTGVIFEFLSPPKICLLASRGVWTCL